MKKISYKGKVYVLASMQRDCQICKAEDQKWYYFVAHEEYGEYPNGDTFGPFNSEESAIKHLDDNHSNPGGWSTDNSGKCPVPKNVIRPRSRF